MLETPDCNPIVAAGFLWQLYLHRDVRFGNYPVDQFSTNIYEIVKFFNDRSPRVGVSTLVVHNGKLLLGRRKGSHCEGVLNNPGGRQDFGKTLEEAALDEVWQEAGLRVEIVPRYPKQSWFMVTEDVIKSDHVHFHTFWFLAHPTDSDPKPINREPQKCDGWNWYSWDDIHAEIKKIEDISHYQTQMHWLPMPALYELRDFLGL